MWWRCPRCWQGRRPKDARPRSRAAHVQRWRADRRRVAAGGNPHPGLDTIVSGHCISSCSIMQSGGVNRYLGGDLPLVDSVQIHAASSGGRITYAPSPRMTQIYTGNYGGGMDAGLLHKAMYEVLRPNGLLVFRDRRAPRVPRSPSIRMAAAASWSPSLARTSAATTSSTRQAIAIRRHPACHQQRQRRHQSGLPAHRAPVAGLRRRDFARWNTDWASTYIKLRGEPVQRLHAGAERHRHAVAAAAACRPRPPG